MFLIGQYDSPFVRRTAIALRLYGIAFEHKPWSTFGDAETIAPYNPLRRVPTLVLDSGEALEGLDSKTELADRVGMTLANLSILKTGKARAIRFSTLEAICRAVSCQPGDILRFEPEEAEPGEPGAASKRAETR